MPKLLAQARARKIKLLLFDVDGVLTDGKLFIFPAPAGTQQSILEQSAKHGGQGGFGLHSQSLIEAKGFHAHDGTSISLARLAGIKTGLITKRISETVALRARDLKLEYVRHEIIWAPAIAGAFVMTSRGGDFDLHIGQDISIGYSSHTDTAVRLYLQETFTFLLLTTEAAVGASAFHQGADDLKRTLEGFQREPCGQSGHCPLEIFE